MTTLVIVESPNKVASIAGYLGDGYVVDSSVGHIRDLPKGADQVPAKFKGEPWARLGVNVDDGFVDLVGLALEDHGEGLAAHGHPGLPGQHLGLGRLAELHDGEERTGLQTRLQDPRHGADLGLGEGV